jgi:NAD(P)-dependent dehydrogenase (short-subunit alcohol dehydrogenase family)
LSTTADALCGQPKGEGATPKLFLHTTILNRIWASQTLRKSLCQTGHNRDGATDDSSHGWLFVHSSAEENFRKGLWLRAFWVAENLAQEMRPVFETNSIKMSTNPKIAFITRGDCGLGLQTARQLGRLGVLVVLGSREVERGNAAAAALRSEGIAAGSLRCDVTKPQDRRAVRDYFDQRYGRLDILINTTGVLMEREDCSSAPAVNGTSAVSPEMLRQAFEANFFGPVALTRGLLPLIRKSPAGRIVNLSSTVGSFALLSNPRSHIYPPRVFAYDASKAALNAFTVHLAHELRETPIKVNSAPPGCLNTDMGGPNAEVEIPERERTSTQLAIFPADGPTADSFQVRKSLPG